MLFAADCRSRLQGITAERLPAYLELVGFCLADLSIDFQRRRMPDRHHYDLRVYLDNLEHALKGPGFESDLSRSLFDLLIRHRVERVWRGAVDLICYRPLALTSDVSSHEALERAAKSVVDAFDHEGELKRLAGAQGTGAEVFDCELSKMQGVAGGFAGMASDLRVLHKQC